MTSPSEPRAALLPGLVLAALFGLLAGGRLAVIGAVCAGRIAAAPDPGAKSGIVAQAIELVRLDAMAFFAPALIVAAGIALFPVFAARARGRDARLVISGGLIAAFIGTGAWLVLGAGQVLCAAGVDASGAAFALAGIFAAIALLLNVLGRALSNR